MEVDNAVFIEEDVSPDPLRIDVSSLRMVHFRMLVVVLDINQCHV